MSEKTPNFLSLFYDILKQKYMQRILSKYNVTSLLFFIHRKKLAFMVIVWQYGTYTVFYSRGGFCVYFLSNLLLNSLHNLLRNMALLKNKAILEIIITIEFNFYECLSKCT